MFTRALRLLSTCMLLWQLPTPADAQDAARPAADKPWARGVSAADQDAALSAFEQGNDYFAERRYALSLEHYRRAVGHWSHPAIHFNMAVCMIHLDAPIDALQHIEQALAYNAAPLGDALYAEGLTYRKLLQDRLGTLTVEAAQRDVEVSLDGEDLMTGPGQATRVVLPGRHQLVATLAGHIPETRTVQVVAGTSEVVALSLQPLGTGVAYARPMPTWLPWTTLGAGLVVGGVGLGLRALADARLSSYDRGVAAACPTGCAASDVPADVRAERDSGELLDLSGLVVLGVGATAALTGLTLLLLNQPRPVERPTPTAGLSVSVVPPQLSGTF